MSLWGKLPQIDCVFLCVVYSQKLKVPSIQRIGPHHIDVLSVIFGALLADAFAEKRTNSTRICFSQESTNVAYLRRLHFFFAERFYTNPKVPKLTKRIGVGNKVRFVCRFKTWSFQSLNWIHQIFYEKTEHKKFKVLPQDGYLETYCTPLALAIWIMDDGSKSGSGLKRATNCFSLAELNRLSAFLYRVYKLKNSVNSAGKKDQYAIYVWKESMPKLVLLTHNYILPSMVYKFGTHAFSTHTKKKCL